VKKDENGVTVEIQNIKAARWSKRDALRFLEFANERKQAAIDAARKSSGTKEVDIFEDLPYESAKKGRP